MSDYQIQIIHKQKGLVKGWEPGTSVEADLIEEVIRRAKLKGIGMFTREATVAAAVTEAWAELLWELKLKV